MIDIEWDEKYSVGHDRIDHEHQIFINLIKNISCADDNKIARERIIRLLLEVKKYAEFHFYSEENIMLDAQYTGYEEHREEHRVLLSTLDERIYNYRMTASPLEEIVEFMFSWFALHTTRSDKKLVKHLNDDMRPIQGDG